VSVPSAESGSSHVGGRPVTNIHTRIPAGAFLVYYFLTQDRIRCDRAGQFLNGANEVGTLFGSWAEAETFARSVADLDPRIGSGIYNSAWQVVAEFVHERFVQQQAEAHRPSRLFLWAGLLLTAGSLFLWLEVRSGWTLMFGFLIGARLLLAGLLKLAKGVYGIKRGTKPSS
jgi:hypothetical protein